MFPTNTNNWMYDVTGFGRTTRLVATSAPVAAEIFRSYWSLPSGIAKYLDIVHLGPAFTYEEGVQ